MNYKSVALGTTAYTLVTFPLAVAWHVILFEEKYKAFGYFEGACQGLFLQSRPL